MYVESWSMETCSLGTFRSEVVGVVGTEALMYLWDRVVLSAVTEGDGFHRKWSYCLPKNGPVKKPRALTVIGSLLVILCFPPLYAVVQTLLPLLGRSG